MTRGILPATNSELKDLEDYADSAGDDGLASVIMRLQQAEELSETRRKFCCAYLAVLQANGLHASEELKNSVKETQK